MRTYIWYNLGGFLMLSWLVLGLGAVARLGKVQGWATWFFAVLAAGFSMTAGAYAAQGTWIEGLLVWVIRLHPVILLVLGLGFVVLVVQLLKAAVPDNLVSYAMTATLVTLAFFVPLLAQHAVPPGKVGQVADEVSTSVSNSVVDATRGWFA